MLTVMVTTSVAALLAENRIMLDVFVLHAYFTPFSTAQCHEKMLPEKVCRIHLNLAGLKCGVHSKFKNSLQGSSAVQGSGFRVSRGVQSVECAVWMSSNSHKALSNC